MNNIVSGGGVVYTCDLGRGEFFQILEVSRLSWFTLVIEM